MRMELPRDKPYWIVVADDAGAVVYGRETMRGPLSELFSLRNEAARMKTGELLSDRGGRSFDSLGQGRHTMTKEHGPKEHASEVFAKDIAERIRKAVHGGDCRGYALIAAPRFLGRLNESVSRIVSEPPFLAIDKNVVGRETAFIEKLIADYRET